MISLSQLTDNSWIFKSNSSYGILFKKQSNYNLKTSTISIDFGSLNDIEEKYGKISYVEREVVEAQDTINGYPVKDKNIVIVDNENVIYSKKNSYTISTVEFYAGYWSVKYNNGWTLNFCPKVSTINSYPHEGPFRTKLECMNTNNQLNTRDIINDRNIK